MIKLIATLALWLFLYQFSTEMVLSSLNKSLQKEGFFDTSYRLNSYQIVSKLSSSEEKKDWYEFYNKKKEVKVNDKLEFDLPSYNFYFQSNLKKLNSFTNLDTLEKIDDPFIEQIIYYLRIGKSVRFEVKDRILYFFSNDLYSPYKTYYLKEKFDLHNYKKYNPTNLKLKDGTILTDTSKLTDYERFLIHLSNNIIDLPKESSLDELVYFLDMDLFNFTITFENDKVIVWNFDQPILISNLQTEKVKEILDKFCSTYKASTLFKKFFSDGTCYIKFRKETIYIQKVNEVTTILIILEFDKPESSNDDKQASKENKKKNVKYLADFFQNDGLKFELKFAGCKGTFIKKLKTLKKIRVNGKEYFFK